jgi:VIT1/CCC1 family predicted Fe2+/Mn2+ transporter
MGLIRDFDAHEGEDTPGAVAARLAATNRQSYLGDFILGAIDGAVTTFAIIAGVAGAGLSAGVAIVLGLANVLADGFSMAAANFLKSRADRHLVDHARHIEERHIDEVPDVEREEIRQIFSAKGFDGDILERIVEVITHDRKRWIDTMITEEFGLQLDGPEPLKAALTTFAAFLSAGLIPILPLFLAGRLEVGAIYTLSASATALTFALIGIAKGRLLHQSLFRSAAETLFLGGSAAALAFFVGAWLRGWVGA